MKHPTSTFSRALRFSIWTILICVLLVGQIYWLWTLRGPGILAHFSTIRMGMWILQLPVIGLVLLLATTPADAIRIAPRRSIFILLAGTMLLETLAVLWLLPALSDDVVGYRLDARTWLTGVSPYSVSPIEMQKRALANPKYAPDEIDLSVRRPELHTIRPPVAQLMFVIGESMNRLINSEARFNASDSSPRNWPALLRERNVKSAIVGFQIVSAIAMLGATAALIGILHQYNRSVWWAIIFAWNPLLILATGGMAEIAAAAVMLVLLAIYAMKRGRFTSAVILLALAAGVNALAIPIIFWVMGHAKRQRGRRSAWIVCLLFIAAVLAIYVPILSYHKGYRGFGRSLLAQWK